MPVTPQKGERLISAHPVSRGIGIGRVVYLSSDDKPLPRRSLNESEIDDEIARLKTAVDETVGTLRDLAGGESGDSGQAVSTIFSSHLAIIEHSSLVENTGVAIRDERVNAEWALKLVSDRYVERQRAAADPGFREKADDIDDVAQRILAALSGRATADSGDETGVVFVARQLKPSAIMELSKGKPAALVTEQGGWTSHTSIIAREFKVPMVTGVHDLGGLAAGDLVVVNGADGQIIVNPSPETLAAMSGPDNGSVSPDGTSSASSLLTLDGTEITVRANVGSVERFLVGKSLGIRGIGLYRSESVIGPQGQIPGEDEQISTYAELADVAGTDRVKIRTFDFGVGQYDGDRFREANPALGLRSLRLSLSSPQVFREQIRSILQAAHGRDIDIVLPMVSGVAEILRSKAIISEEAERLAADGRPSGEPKLGAMIELPSAVLTAREIAAHVDFLCLGTNDLVQYLLAVDRDNESVAEWYQTLHPAVLRAVKSVIDAGSAAATPVIVCGEMAGSPFYVPLLLGLGARELSINVNSYTTIRELISGITLSEAVDLVEMTAGSETAEESEKVLREYYTANWGRLFPPGLLAAKHN